MVLLNTDGNVRKLNQEFNDQCFIKFISKMINPSFLISKRKIKMKFINYLILSTFFISNNAKADHGAFGLSDDLIKPLIIIISLCFTYIIFILYKLSKINYAFNLSQAINWGILRVIYYLCTITAFISAFLLISFFQDVIFGVY